MGDPSRTLEGNSRKRSQSVSGNFPIFFPEFLPESPSRTFNFFQRRAEQAKAKFDPRVGPRRVGPRVAPRARPREHPRGLISLFFSPSRTPHESVQGRGHEWTVGVHLSCFHLFCSLAIFVTRYDRKCSKHVQSNSVASRLLPNSCLLNPGRGPNRTELRGSFLPVSFY